MRSTETVAKGPKARSLPWPHFARRYHETYGLAYPFDGQGESFPPRTRHRIAGRTMPSAAENHRALSDIEARGHSLDETCARIDRMFADPVHVSDGITLARVAFWLDLLESDERFAEATTLVYGGGA